MHSSKTDSIHVLSLSLHLIPPSTRRLCIAFSGGLDSVVLAHCLLSLRDQYSLMIWHVNHGLQSNADAMEDFSRCWAQQYDLPFKTQRLNLDPESGSLEARARDARYGLFTDGLQAGDVLLTAHHANDQAETLLLNLMRGSGVAGLRAIAEQKPLGAGILIRPLLNLGRDEIHTYARANGLNWIEDPSNASERFDRNFLRHRVIPVIEQRWPGAVGSMHRASGWQQEAYELISQLASDDLARLGRSATFTTHLTLAVADLLPMSSARARNLLRYWIEQAGMQPPGASKLNQLLNQLNARQDAMPSIHAQGYSLRIYRSRLYLVSDELVELDEEYRLVEGKRLQIPAIGFNESRMSILARLGRRDSGQALSLRFRRHEERENAHAHRLKRLFQRHAVPPWWRPMTPQVYVDGELVALWVWSPPYSVGS